MPAAKLSHGAGESYAYAPWLNGVGDWVSEDGGLRATVKMPLSVGPLLPEDLYRERSCMANWQWRTRCGAAGDSRNQV